MANMTAKMVGDRMEVSIGFDSRMFDTHPSPHGIAAEAVLAAKVARNGKDWPVAVYIKADGTMAVGYPSGLRPCRGSPRISGFWADSDNQSRHSKV